LTDSNSSISSDDDESLSSSSSVKQQPQHSLSLAKLSLTAGSGHQEPLKYKSDGSVPPREDAQVTFVDMVSVVEIPSHRTYDDEIRQSLWNGTAQVAAFVQRNSLEFSTEHWDWRQVLEEDSFVQLPSGEWMHPATYQRRLQRLQHEKRLQKKKQMKKNKHGYQSIAACLNFPTHNYNPVKKRTTTRKTSGKRSNPATPTARVVGRKVGSKPQGVVINQ
jgi:hypothetical protein